MAQRKQRSTRVTPKRRIVSAMPHTVAGILDGLPLGVVLLTDHCRIQGVNAEGARLLGRSEVSLLGEFFPDIWSALTGSDAGMVGERLNAVASSRVPMPHAIAQLRHGTTPKIPIQWTCQVINHRAPSGLAISLRDLSREEDLREERDRLAAIAEEAPSPIVELDHEGHMLYANPAMTAWLSKLGYRDDGLPKILPNDLPQLVSDCLRSGNAIQGRDVSLAEASFTWTFCPVTTHGLVRGYALDMTNIYKTQHQLIRTATQLQEANRRLDEALTVAQESVRAKATFLAMMSHEIRTPMNGVIGMTTLLLETALSPEQKTYTETIRQCGESLLHVINDVLECSKIEAGKLELECINFDVRAAVEDILAQFAQRAEVKGLELAGLVHADVPTALRGDPARLRQVLTNLVGNALKFTEKGEVTLQAYLEADAPDSTLIRFEVTDTGIGITPDTQAKLFKPFVQGDSSTTRKYGGTGLGLTISKQLIELMGGHIGMTSTVGQGSTFRCTARFSKQADSPRAILPSEDLAGRRVLIVDDNESHRMILRHLVTGWGMTADLAEDAEKALRRIAETSARGISYDLAILDIMMPGKDGLQLARELRQHPAAAGLRVIVLTSLLHRNHAEQAQQAGAVGCLSKPVRHDQLRECLRKILAGKRDAASTHSAAAIPTASSRGPAPADTGPKPHVLIVEDNAINQKLAARMMEKLGYHPHVAGNGQEALAALAKDDYSLILMDCQMPVLDGFEATRIIREREASLGRPASPSQRGEQDTPDEAQDTQEKRRTEHIPIIAVTANAMQGDRTRCLAAGMDDYIAKPIQLELLRKVLKRWAPPPTAPVGTVEAGSAVGSSAPTVFDPAKVLKNIGGDHQLFHQLIAMFLTRYRVLLDEVKSGLAQADAQVLERAAHTLKGAAGNLCASEVMSTAAQLEALGREGLFQNAPPVFAQLETDVIRLVGVLDRYREGQDTLPQAA
jgi:signal transduction histidine kinase/DNA-binding response OmpR family regulator/HPt (histidine-containing phosphotransfer) domain-containing protein/PAS domain-containing protein